MPKLASRNTLNKLSYICSLALWRAVCFKIIFLLSVVIQLHKSPNTSVQCPLVLFLPFYIRSLVSVHDVQSVVRLNFCIVSALVYIRSVTCFIRLLSHQLSLTSESVVPVTSFDQLFKLCLIFDYLSVFRSVVRVTFSISCA